MSYESKNLSVGWYANGFTHWHYRTEDEALSEVEQPGYFNEARDMLRTGDMIAVNARFGDAGIYLVICNQGSTVNVRKITI